MAVHFVLEEGYLHVRLSGEFSLHESMATLRLAEALIGPAPGLGLVWDVRERTGLPGANEAKALWREYRRWTRTAILTRSGGQYGVARMTSIFDEERTVRAFTSAAAALEWVSGAVGGEESRLA